MQFQKLKSEAASMLLSVKLYYTTLLNENWMLSTIGKAAINHQQGWSVYVCLWSVDDSETPFISFPS